MPEIIEKHRESRKSPSVLQHSLILVRSARPDDLVFIFEGPDDIGVYETWIGRTRFESNYEPIAGKGKEQLIGLYKKIISENPELLRKVYFFIDCDFDVPEPADNIFTLNGYSIENFLCTSSTLESLLADEFKCVASPVERQRIKCVFEEFLNSFQTSTEELHFKFFSARRQGIKIISKSEDSKPIVEVYLDKAVPAFQHLEDVIETEKDVDATALAALRQEFAGLHRLQAQRGKYVLCVFRRWLRLLTADRKQPTPQLFERGMPALSGEPWSASLRRLAGQSPLPAGLAAFVEEAGRAA
ncbi:hypothetical protein CSQ93_24985 [Janthinobacterium sp. BJB426]|uniref:DUF4435 domain-containing protein n=1 Tax=Janthinobacterium sp. BJB426 TaxID=2048010 RepID=UPI000C0DF278|nr:DUF4435 domain-containing protein [Janthinobacterium sp. BJB426]PHV25249.1 hypothetical protein CSQ93_24985 [Janthinobacterium sp. BJB426]